MQLSEFDYTLPSELIAQEPLADRAASRMLVIDRAAGMWEDRTFRELPSYIKPRDCLVVNDSRVFPSRLFGRREMPASDAQSGGAAKAAALREGRVEIFLTKQITADALTWTALVRPGRKMRSGERIVISEELSAQIIGRGEFGERTVRLIPRDASATLWDVLDRAGHVPLPPYIHRPDGLADRERYQTVFARERGSVAAPTAGLHFTAAILDACRNAGAEIARVTLHVGLGTFQALHAETVEDVKLHSESFSVPPETVRAMEEARRVIAVGTTSVRAIESAARIVEYPGEPGDRAEARETDLFISPGFEFRRTQALLTNFHLPQSSLLILACAFAGRELTLAAYRHAVERKYRFFSYGDCMLIL